MNGYFDQAKLKKTLNELSEAERKSSVPSKLAEIWNLYHGSLAVTSQQLLTQTVDFLTKYWNDIPFDGLTPLCTLVISLGVDDFNDFPDRWIIERLPTATISTLQLYRQKASNSKTQELIDKNMARLVSSVNPKDIVYKIISSLGWSQDDQYILSRLTEDDYYNWITTDTDPELLSKLRRFRQLFNSRTTDPESQKISATFEKAIRRIPQSDPLKKLQLSRLIAAGDE